MRDAVILLWGIPGDEPTAAVYAALERLGQRIVFLNQQEIQDTGIDLSVHPELRATLHLPSGNVDLGTVAAAYLRPYDSQRLPAIAQSEPDSALRRHAMAVDDTMLCWSELTPARVINRPSASASNNSKPYQSALIRRSGLRTPDTLITTDPAAALEFWEQHGRVIYKSVSGVRSIVTQLSSTHHERLKQVENCPTQFQQYIDGVDIRAHVVGDELFACEIRSEADDYRYAGRTGAGVTIHPCDVPWSVADACRKLAGDLALPLAGIDLRHTPGDEWYCFEVNPSPGFTFYEQVTGHPISAAVARLLVYGA